MGKQTQSKGLLESFIRNAPAGENVEKAINNLNIILADRRMDKSVRDSFKRLLRRNPSAAT